MTNGEFGLIGHIVDVLDDAARGPDVAVGPGDDAAVLCVPAGRQLVVSTDTLVAGRHYPEGAAPDLIGYRSMAAAVSDLAAMGADPAWATVSLTAPELAPSSAKLFAEGCGEAARRFGIKIVGGNLAKGPQSVTVTVHGHVPADTALTRSGAQAGDRIYVTGALGGAVLALEDMPRLRNCARADLREDSPLYRYWRPTPRIAFGVGLRSLATAAIDISDGFAADLAHLCKASAVRCEIDLERLPTFAGCDPRQAASAGDDYELAFTAPPQAHDDILALAEQSGVAATNVGVMLDGAPFAPAWSLKGQPTRLPAGFRHF